MSQASLSPHRAHNWHYEPSPFAPEKQMLQRFSFAVFCEGSYPKWGGFS
jgi:hypothetical protein